MLNFTNFATFVYLFCAGMKFVHPHSPKDFLRALRNFVFYFAVFVFQEAKRVVIRLHEVDAKGVFFSGAESASLC
jgi:hypothetical protein